MFECKRSQTDLRHVVKASSKKLVYLRLSMKSVWQLVEMALWQCLSVIASDIKVDVHCYSGGC